MYIGILNLKNDKSKRLWLVILSAVTVAVILIGITVYLLANDENTNIGIGNKVNIFEATKYNYQANAKIYGNKTINDYYIEEEYENNDGNYKFRFNTKNDNNEVSYVIENNTLKISSPSQLNEYVLSDYIVKKTNILSVSTFISLYYNIDGYIKENVDTEDVKIEIEEIENKTCYRILVKNSQIDILKEYEEIFSSGMDINKFELYILNDTNMPIQYVIYDKEGKAYVDIQYTFFLV